MSSERKLTYPSVSVDNLAVVACANIVHNDKNQVSIDQVQSNHAFVHESVGGKTTEIVREEVAMDASGGAAEATLGVLVTVAGEQSMKQVVKAAAAATIVSSVQGTSVANMSIDGSISWDRDESCLYLSANKAFRFRFSESDGVSPSMLVLEGLNASTLEYAPKVEFSTD